MKRITRSGLTNYFKANAIPTADHFEALINGFLSSDDGIEKESKDHPLKIAVGTTQNNAISLHEELDKPPSWSLSLKGDGNSGLSVNDKERNSRLFIDEATGSIGIGTDAIKEKQQLHVDGNLYVDGELRVTGHAFKDKGGDIWKKGTSDERLKDVVDEDIKGALGLLLELKGVRYKWKQECQEKYRDDFDDKEHVGFIAQQIEQLDEELLSRWVSPGGDHYVIDSEKFEALEVTPDTVPFQALTVEALRELNTKIESSEKDQLHLTDWLRVDGAIRVAQGSETENGIMFSNTEGGVAATWMRSTQEQSKNIFEIGTVGDISLNPEGGSITLKANLVSKGKISAEDSLEVKGAFQPSVGNSETNGIMFPKNPRSGGRDAAWIRYYARSGENTILEIGTSNDRADHIVFNASGNIGIGTDEPKAKLHIKTASDVALGKEEGGALILGDSKGEHLAMDNNEIMAKKNGTTAGTLYLQNNGGDVSIGGTIKGTVEISSRWGNWLFLKQERATEGGGGFVIHNPWRDGDSSVRNGISIAYKDQQGTVNWGNGINFNGPTGKFTIGTELNVKGVIQPSVGKSEANGIMFPKNPGGGGRDAAWIRYYARSGENTILEIGTSNDRADHIVFNASGNIGVGTNEPKAKLHIKTASDVQHNKEGGGALILGDSAGLHLALDNNEIMAKKNGTTPGKLHLQMQGGDTSIGGDLEVKGSAEITRWAEESLNPNGYARIGRLLIQWGTHNKREDKKYDIKFPKTFSKQCFSVVINRQLAGAISPMYAINITKEKFSIDREDGIHGPQTINWIAVGV